MCGIPFSDQMKWRTTLERLIRHKCTENNLHIDLTFIHPPMFYGGDDEIDEREAKEWLTSQLKDSDIVAVDLSTIADSIGTHIELGIVKAMNEFGYKHIYVVGVGRPNVSHPWIRMGILRQEDTIEEAADYICTHLLL